MGIAKLDVNEKDCVIGIAASGRTPYVIGGLQEAKARGALTVSIACNRPSSLEGWAGISITPVVGPEVISGSTRLKAGTAQKMVLNMISTAVMIRLGKTYSNLMVDVQPTNAKLRQRARRIVAEATGLELQQASRVLSACDGEVKTAIVTILAGVSPEIARDRLHETGGYARKAIGEWAGVSSQDHGVQTKYILGVDGGGTKTVAMLGDLEGNVIARGFSGSSNTNAVGFEAACLALENAIHKARADHPGEISAMCLGLAGAGRNEEIEQFQNWAAHKFPKTLLKVVSDAEILLVAGAPVGPVLALICGTGSIVYGRTVTGELIRAGGWGYLLGDEGSGYAIGIAALRAVMQAYDGRGAETLLSELVLKRYGVSAPADLVRSIYAASSLSIIASLTDLVEQAAGSGDPVAIAILEESSRELVRTLAAVYPKLGASTVPLILSGGTILRGRYLRKAFQQACERYKLEFTSVQDVVEPAEGALKSAWQLSRG
jgi:N-acetylmuramic acid 6-phosphate etherase